jgi:hypothetical protein
VSSEFEQVIEIPAKDRDAAANRVRAFLLNCLPGKGLSVRITKAKRERSDVQNKALWGLAYKVLSDNTGHEPEELHEYFCGEFFGWEEYEIFGARKKRPRRTTTRDENGKRDVISKMQCAEFFDFIQRRADAVGIYIPNPDPMWFMHEQAREAA